MEIYGFYIVDVDKCTKNINTSKQNRGKYDIIFQARAYLYTSPMNSAGTAWTPKLPGYTVALLGNLNSLTYTDYRVYNNDKSICTQIYGIPSEDVKEYNLVTLREWLYEYLSEYGANNSNKSGELTISTEQLAFTDVSGPNWTSYIAAYTPYIVEVSKCTKSVNIQRSNLGKYEIFIVNQLYCLVGGSTDIGHRKYSTICLPLLNNLNAASGVITYDGTDSTRRFSRMWEIYGMDSYDYYNIDNFDLWLHNYFVEYHKDPVYGDATKIGYTDGSYDIIRSVLNEEQAKSHAYNQLLNTYGSFYKATETHINETLKKMSS